jgi:hypothetical protein
MRMGVNLSNFDRGASWIGAFMNTVYDESVRNVDSC